jgi:tetratricopeptide (TPR) repeat protein
LVVTADGKRLISGANDGSLRIWESELSRSRVESRWSSVAIRRHADQLVESLYDRNLVLTADCLAALDQDRFLNPAFRDAAVRLLRQRGDSPELFHDACWKIVVHDDQPKAAYQRAWHFAETAFNLNKNNWKYWTARGIARYRLGNYRDALRSLASADRFSVRSLPLIGVSLGSAQPANVAFLAMTYHRLGRASEAQTTYAKLLELMQLPQHRNDAEVQAFLREATATLGS